MGLLPEQALWPPRDRLRRPAVLSGELIAASSVRAGAAYFAVAFGAGFALGVPRTLVVEPRLGEVAALLLELPVMLAMCWLACGWLLHRLAVPARIGPRLLMSGTALVLLLMAELGLAALLLGRSPIDHAAGFLRWPSALGFAAQLAYALFPLRRVLRPAARP